MVKTLRNRLYYNLHHSHVNLMMEIPWFIGIKYIIITISIGLTYFERVQRGKYDFKI